MLATSCWLTPRSKAGVMTVICVGVTLVTKPSLAAAVARIEEHAHRRAEVRPGDDDGLVAGGKAGGRRDGRRSSAMFDGGSGGMTGSWKLSVTDLGHVVDGDGDDDRTGRRSRSPSLWPRRWSWCGSTWSGLSDVSVKFAFSVVVANSTAVPFGTGALFCVTVAVIVDVEPVNGDAVVTARAMFAPTGGWRPATAARPVAARAGDGRRSGRRLAFASREKRQ